MVKLLIENNANVNAVDRDGHTALDATSDATEGKLKIEKKTSGLSLKFDSYYSNSFKHF